MGVVCQNNIWENPNVVSDFGMLSNVNVAVEPNMVANMAITLDVTQGAYLKTLASDSSLSDRDTMPGCEGLTEV